MHVCHAPRTILFLGTLRLLLRVFLVTREVLNFSGVNNCENCCVAIAHGNLYSCLPR